MCNETSIIMRPVYTVVIIAAIKVSLWSQSKSARNNTDAVVSHAHVGSVEVAVTLACLK
jgi:hypothetical protein